MAIVPRVGRTLAHRTSTSSVWPLPLTPATPTISPAGTSIDTPSRRGAPSPANVRSRIESAAIAVAAGIPGASASASPALASFGDSLPTSPVITAAAAVSAAAPIINAAMASGSRPAAGRVTTRRPRRSTVTRSAISITSCSLCEMNSTPMPVAVRRRIDANRRATSWGTSTAVGSSRMSTRHSLNSALTISTRCRSPTDSCSTTASGRTSTPSRAAADATASRAVRRSTGPYPTRVSITFSVTVIGPTSENSWVTIPTPARIASFGERRYTARPSTRSSPASGWLNP